MRTGHLRLMADAQPARLTKTSKAEAPSDDLHLLDAYSRAVVEVVEAVGPAVLGVRSVGAAKKDAQGQGSGVLITPDGYALTNDHVVAAARELRVALPDGQEAAARLVGRDPATDLALLRIEAGTLPFARLEAERALRPGQLAIAIGNPLGFESTVTSGVVSATGRSLPGRHGGLIENVVQHTAPLNPGNSGGPLLDSAGGVIGINTAIIPFAQGIGFAVPATTAHWVVTQLLQHGRVKRARLGIAGQTRPIDRRLARRLELAQPSVVQVVSVEDDSPAARAGLRAGDWLLALDGQPTLSMDALFALLRSEHIGEEIELAIVRERERRTVTLRPDEH